MSELATSLPHKVSSGSRECIQHSLFELAQQKIGVALSGVKPLSWRDAQPRRRRTRGGVDARSRLIHFSPPGSLLSSVISSEGSKNQKAKCKQLDYKRPSFSAKVFKPTALKPSFTAGHKQRLASKPPIPLMGFRIEKETSCNMKSTSTRGKKQHAKPRFKITSSTARKKMAMCGKSSKPRKNTGARKHKMAPPSVSSNTGSVFLKHLNFRPIRDSVDKACASSSASCKSSVPASSEINYKGWMKNNASVAMTSTSHDDEEDSSTVQVDSSCLSNTKEQNLCGDGENQDQLLRSYNGELDRESWVQKVRTYQGRAKNPQITDAASQTHRSSQSSSSQALTKRSPTTQVEACANLETQRDASVSQLSAECPEKRVKSFEGDDSDAIADREMEEIVFQSEGNNLSPQSLGVSAGGKDSTKCVTPHVSCAVGTKTHRHCYNPDRSELKCTCSKSCQNSISPLSKSSDSNSCLIQPLALDNISKERVEREFNLCLGKYLCLLCGQSSNSAAASKRLQARILKHKQNCLAALATRDYQEFEADKSNLPLKPDHMHSDVASNPSSVDSMLTPGVKGEGSHEGNCSRNKTDEFDLDCCLTKQPPPQRPYSSPAKDKGLTCSTKRGPTPSLRYLLNCAALADQSRKICKQNAASSKPMSTSRKEGFAVDEAFASGQERKPPKGKQGVFSKPPAWRAASQTEDIGQIEESAGYMYGRQPRSRPQSISKNVSDPAVLVSSSSSNGIIINRNGNIGSPIGGTASSGKRYLRTNSYEAYFPPESEAREKSPTARFPNRCLLTLNEPMILYSNVEEKSPKETSLHIKNVSKRAATPVDYISGDFTGEVSSKVEADLQRYNAVMDRCRALLGENDPEEKESSTWTESTDIGAGHKQNLVENVRKLGDSIRLQTSRFENNERTGLRNNAVERRNDDVYTDLKGGKFKLEPSRMQTAQPHGHAMSAAKVEKSRMRPCSALCKKHERSQGSLLSPKRCSSNPMYLGMVEFSSSEAIRRLLDRHVIQQKPKVTFDISNDESGGSISSTGDYPQHPGKTLWSDGATYVQAQHQRPDDSVDSSRSKRNKTHLPSCSRIRKRSVTKKKKRSLKTTGSISKVKPSEKRSDILDEAFGSGPPMKPVPKSTNERCTSRKPLRSNPYYKLTLKGKRHKTDSSPDPRPCSQSSWKTVDTDYTTMTSPNQTVCSLWQGSTQTIKKKKKKKKKRKTKAVGEKASTEDNEQPTTRPPGGKRIKQARTIKTPVTGVEATGEGLSSDNDTVCNEKANSTLESEDILCSQLSEPAVKTPVVAKTDTEIRESPDSGNCKEERAKSQSKPTALHFESSTMHSNTEGVAAGGGEHVIRIPKTTDLPKDETPQTSERYSASCRSVSFDVGNASEPSRSPVRHNLSRLSSKTMPTRHRPSKVSTAGRHHQATSSQQKPFLCGKFTSKTTPAKDAPKTKTRNTKRSEKPKTDSEAKLSDVARAIETATTEEQQLELYRTAFATYKELHPELVETSPALLDTSKTMVLRKCGPLVVALLIQLLVQYTYVH
ncbi:hypothetical protein PoB_000649100 [Plakobranchus ocellatus]|uniref:Uncharacterized protein n=1 Tax=Plakobranchus ocellatus TaxID=259542 RepID=A0AAV3XYG1_9GAST|nr:hypothetical protein PoB_000649100 [Plakobranchus ocellatus]